MDQLNLVLESYLYYGRFKTYRSNKKGLLNSFVPIPRFNKHKLFAAFDSSVPGSPTPFLFLECF